MKTRFGFVSNSSSTSFIIENKTSEKRSILDFAKENAHLLDEFNKSYRDDITLEDFLVSAEKDYSDEILAPGSNFCVFGDEQGTTLGRVYDYILRDGGDSKNFSWRFEEYNR